MGKLSPSHLSNDAYAWPIFRSSHMAPGENFTTFFRFKQWQKNRKEVLSNIKKKFLKNVL